MFDAETEIAIDIAGMCIWTPKKHAIARSNICYTVKAEKDKVSGDQLFAFPVAKEVWLAVEKHRELRRARE